MSQIPTPKRALARGSETSQGETSSLSTLLSSFGFGLSQRECGGGIYLFSNLVFLFANFPFRNLFIFLRFSSLVDHIVCRNPSCHNFLACLPGAPIGTFVCPRPLYSPDLSTCDFSSSRNWKFTSKNVILGQSKTGCVSSTVWLSKKN